MVALLARSECILPYAYLEAVLKYEGRQPWSFYKLNGCPREVFVPMLQIANLSAVREDTKAVRRLVSEIEQSVESYEYPGAGLVPSRNKPESDDDDEDEDDENYEETMHMERDRYHCCEGFRYSLLIYILRIFHLNSKARSQTHLRRTRSRISFFSRVCLDHIAACRSSHLIQKQCLLPVFIAGCETRMPSQRQFATEFCRTWFRKYGYQMYTTVLEVMQVVWAEQDAGNERFWWGDELDRRRESDPAGDLVQFCFG